MPRGRPVTPVTKKEILLLVKKEIEKALGQLEVKATLLGAKRKGRPIGSKLRKNKPRK